MGVLVNEFFNIAHGGCHRHASVRHEAKQVRPHLLVIHNLVL